MRPEAEAEADDADEDVDVDSAGSGLWSWSAHAPGKSWGHCQVAVLGSYAVEVIVEYNLRRMEEMTGLVSPDHPISRESTMHKNAARGMVCS